MAVENRENRVLVIQARLNADVITKEQANLRRIAEGTGVELTFLNPLISQKAQWDNPYKLLLNYGSSMWLGSADIDFSQPTKEKETYINTALPLAKAVLAEGEPALGICLGHQTLALAAGAKVKRIEGRNETGTTELTLTPEGEIDPAFTELPRPITMVFGHKDSVEHVPEGFTRLGYTERDPNSSLRRGRILTTQGHPEITETKELKVRIALTQHSRLGAYVPTYEIFNPSPTDRIIKNFLSSVSQKERNSG